MSNFKETKPNYSEPTAVDIKGRPVEFNDFFNKWLDDFVGAVDDNEGSINQATEDISTLQTDTADLQSDVSGLNSNVSSLSSSVSVLNTVVLDLVAPPAFSCFASSSTALTANVERQLTSWTEEYDNGGDFASGAFTAPSSGRYYFAASVTFAVGGDQNRLRVLLKKNGTNQAIVYAPSSGNAFASVVLTRSLNLIQGDLVTLYALNVDSADTVQTSVNTTFSGYRICPV